MPLIHWFLACAALFCVPRRILLVSVINGLRAPLKPEMNFRQKLERSGPKKLLACDGGGVRGIVSIEILASIEMELRKLTNNSQLVLADYFDYVTGTSVGAIIATLVALGLSVDHIRDFFIKTGLDMFHKARLWERFRTKFRDDRLSAALRAIIGQNTTIGSDLLRTLLMIVLRNATTNSPWPICNNPLAKFNDRKLPDCNLNLPLWQLVRASTAAPTYFPPEVITVGEQTFIFVDGGVTVYNNPAFQLFLMATSDPYRLCWPVGREQLLLVSVGNGTSTGTESHLTPTEMNIFYHANSIPAALMASAQHEQDLLCRMFGETMEGEPLDGEVDDLKGRGIPGATKLFTYLRYNAELSREGLKWLGLSHINPSHVQQWDSINFVDEMREIGAAIGRRKVKADHFARFLA
jgi:patatin-like phospholipase/acyl hydrolase